MKRHWIVPTFIAAIVVFMVWGHARLCMAKDEVLSITKPERFYSIKLSKKLDLVLGNQEQILKYLEEIKKVVMQ